MIVENYPAHALSQIERGKNHEQWALIQHHRIVDLMQRKMLENGFYGGKTRCAVTMPQKQDMIAVVEVYPPDVHLLEGQKMYLGVVNCYSCRRPSALFGCLEHEGVGVVCERYHVKKSRGFNWDEESLYRIDHQIDLFIVQCGNFYNRVREMRLRWMSATDQDIALVHAARENIIAWKYIGHANKRLMKGGRQDLTAWECYRAIAATVAAHHPPVSSNPATDQLTRLWQLRRLLMGVNDDVEYEASRVGRGKVRPR